MSPKTEKGDIPGDAAFFILMPRWQILNRFALPLI